MARKHADEQSKAIATLREWIPTGSRVFTILRSVSSSGMSREIGVVVWPKGSTHPIHPNFHTARVLGERLGKRDGVIVRGAGMDMGFDLVYRLACALHGDPAALSQEWL